MKFALLIMSLLLASPTVGVCQPAGPQLSTTGTNNNSSNAGGNTGGSTKTDDKPLEELIKDPDAHVIATRDRTLTAQERTTLTSVDRNCVIQGAAGEVARNAITSMAQALGYTRVPGNYPIFVHIVWFSPKQAATGGNAAVNSGESEPGRDCWFTVDKKASGITVSTTRRIYGESSFGVLFLHLDVFNPDLFDVRYYGMVKRKLPQNVRNLLALLRLATLPVSAQNLKEPISYYGFGYETNVPRTSDITLLPIDAKGSTPRLIGHKVDINNEGKHWWDVSVGVPVTKLTGLEYSQTDGRFNPKEINKQNIFGMFNIFWPADLEAPLTLKSSFRILLGTGITGRPGDRFFFGGGLGIKELQVFAGSAWATFEQPVMAGGTQTTAQRYRSRFAMGINIPVLSAIKALSK